MSPSEERAAQGWIRHDREQRRAWLRTTYSERLEWLAQAKRFHALAVGAARGVHGTRK